MNRFKIFSKALLLLLVTLLTFAVTGCSDDETEGWDTTYGYVQFKKEQTFMRVKICTFMYLYVIILS